MKKILIGTILTMTLIVGVGVSNNQYEYKIISETKEFIVGNSISNVSKNNKGIFLVKNEETSHIKKGDVVIVEYDKNKDIKEVKVK